jgi:hypothetical protein
MVSIFLPGGILSSRSSFENKPTSGSKHQRKPSDDFIMGSGSSLSVIQSSVAKMSMKDHPKNVEQQHEENGAALVDVQPIPDPEPVPEPTPLDPPVEPPPEPTPSPAPLPVHQSPHKNLELPPSLAGLNDPHSFKLDVTPPNKRKITKASFNDPASHLTEQDPSDPLSQLDPLWKTNASK